MGMFCDFICASDVCDERIKEFIINEVVYKNLIRCYNTLEEITENNKKGDTFNIVFDAFSLSLSVNDRYLVYKQEDYKINFNFHIHLDIYHEVQDWESEMMRLLGCVMQNFNMDCVLEYYGDVVLIRKNGEIIVDESRTGRLDRFPYELLGINYLEEKIVLD